ncbi:MAG: dimethylarginine dimethylaminohydrolase family protein [Promethearchaeota archaeon]
MMSQRALVREPGAQFTHCISSHPLHHTVNVARARTQHSEYVNMLTELGLEVIQLPRDDTYPDSCFVEDTAVIHSGKALITRLAKQSRRGEEDSVEELLQEYLPVQRIMAPGTLEGGDVIRLSTRIICGISQRTNRAGMEQMQTYFGVPVDTITDPHLIHLKSHVTYLNHNIMLTTQTYTHHPILADFEVLVVPENEQYAANTLTIDDTVIMLTGYPQTQQLIKDTGFEVISLNISEITKCDGALTCLSLLF